MSLFFYLIKHFESINAWIFPHSYILRNAAVPQDVSQILALRAGQSGIYIRAEARNFSLFQSVQTGTSAPLVCVHGMDVEKSYVYLFNDAFSFYDYGESVMNE
jgi:hypothetical protein